MRIYIWCLMMVGVTSDEDVYLVFDGTTSDEEHLVCGWSTSDEDVHLVFDDGRCDF